MSDYEAKLRESLKRFNNFTETQVESCVSMYQQYQTYIRENKKIEWSKIIHFKEDEYERYEKLPEPSEAEAKAALSKVAVLKLNGGLGTSMGCDGPKSLLEVRQGLTFLGFSLKQLETINKRYGVSVPLVLMNSFNTEKATKDFIEQTKPGVEVLYFNQFELPRMDASTYLPAELSGADQFYPPGHGYVYECLRSTGTLKQLADRGIEWIFISNCDNLGAVLDARIACFATRSGKQFVSEQTPKLEADVKGGTLMHYEGAVHLLETAQVPADHMKDFCDCAQFPYFHINNLWCNVQALMKLGKIDLDLIVNPKKVQGKDVIQLECAAGAMVANVNAVPLVVPRVRFRPVKKSGDLLLLQSDCFVVDDNFILQQQVKDLPTVIVDAPVRRLQEMFPSIPSLRQARRFIVEGEVQCADGVVVRGELTVAKGTKLDMTSGQTYGKE